MAILHKDDSTIKEYLNILKKLEKYALLTQYILKKKK